MNTAAQDSPALRMKIADGLEAQIGLAPSVAPLFDIDAHGAA